MKSSDLALIAACVPMIVLFVWLGFFPTCEPGNRLQMRLVLFHHEILPGCGPDVTP